MAWSDIAQPARELLRMASDSCVPLTIRGVDYECWRCGRVAQPPVLVHLEGNAGPWSVVDTTDGLKLAYVRELLGRVGHATASTIKCRTSQTRGEVYLSSGCPSCDALFGKFFLAEEVDKARAGGLVERLPELVTLDRPEIEWWALEGSPDEF